MALSHLGLDGEFLMCPEAGVKEFFNLSTQKRILILVGWLVSETKGILIRTSNIQDPFVKVHGGVPVASRVHFQVQNLDAQVQRNLVMQSFQLERIWRLMEEIQICSQIQLYVSAEILSQHLAIIKNQLDRDWETCRILRLLLSEAFVEGGSKKIRINWNFERNTAC
ncbi:uncharacterized protein LOC107434299 [Ziziphus jujuba]|uniref:Uncharacterized protein LOC107434299 n=1 Tax=Ziziphus jujuba TaxID=326968 RepID=A0ABM3I203_ZIZJJ|nr:uncharacterized protein LOC107434299 [Ziziphus jujuba]